VDDLGGHLLYCEAVGVDSVVGQGVVGLAKALQLTNPAQGMRVRQKGTGNRVAI